MKQITITLDIPDDASESEVAELKRQCQMLASPDWIAVFWGVEDVQSVSELSDDDARDVLHHVLARHDCTIGINWGVLETVADMHERG